MKKILYIVSTLKSTGPTNQLYNIIKYLDRTDFEPYVITLSPDPENSRLTDYKYLGVKVFTLGLSRFSGLFLAKSSIKKLVDQIVPDVIHTQGIRPDVLSAKLDVLIPRLATIRNFPQYDYAMTYGRLLGVLMTWQHSKAMRKLNVCVGVSESVSSNLGEYVELSNAKTICNGVDTELYSPVSAKEKRVLRKALDLSSDAEIWISSGHLSDLKNPIFLINAWIRVFPNDKQKQLIFIGDGPLKRECENIAKGHSNIIFPGRVTNVTDFLKAGDYYVSASKSEGLPNAVLEGLACGLPVLLSDIPPHREMWEMEKGIGRLFYVGDDQSLEFNFRELVESDRFGRSRAALALIEDKLSAEKMSQIYQDTYDDLIKGS